MISPPRDLLDIRQPYIYTSHYCHAAADVHISSVKRPLLRYSAKNMVLYNIQFKLSKMQMMIQHVNIGNTIQY